MIFYLQFVVSCNYLPNRNRGKMFREKVNDKSVGLRSLRNVQAQINETDLKANHY